MILKPFFKFYGGKWRAASHYPAPKHDTLIEPFAGSAGYALHYADRQVKLFDIDPIIVGVWDYLIHVRPSEIARLPLLQVGQRLEEFKLVQEAEWFVGFWLNTGSARPELQMSRGALTVHPSTYWGESIRMRVAMNVQHIRHWTVEQRSFESIADEQATWYVDPPYNNKAGKRYRFHAIDYAKLGEWCQGRDGQVIVCENEGADWLPFEHLIDVHAFKDRSSAEVVWLS